MNLIDMTCPYCGAVLQVSDDSPVVQCEHCDKQFLLDSDTIRVDLKHIENAGYHIEKGRLRAQSDLKQATISHRKRIILPIIVFCLFVLIIVFLIGTYRVFKHNNQKNLQSQSQTTTMQQYQDTDKIIVKEGNRAPVIFISDEIELAVSSCEYTPNASDIRISLTVNNKSNQLFHLEFSDISIDGKRMLMLDNEDTLQVGGWGTNFYFLLNDIQANGVDDFSTILCNLTGSFSDGTELFTTAIEFDRSAFTDFIHY